MDAIQKSIRLLFLTIILFTASSFLAPGPSIKGSWISVDDAQRGIMISDKKWMEVYAQSSTYMGTYTMDTHPCDAAYAKKNRNKKMTFIKVEDGRCFELVEVTAKKLAIRYTTSGKLNVFRKF